MAEERDKTNPDYPVTPAWRPASNPGVRLPAPSLEPVRPASHSADLVPRQSNPAQPGQAAPWEPEEAGQLPRSYMPPPRWADEPANPQRSAPTTPARHAPATPHGASPAGTAPGVSSLGARGVAPDENPHVPPLPPQHLQPHAGYQAQAPGRGLPDGQRPASAGYSVVPASQESIRPLSLRAPSALTAAVTTGPASVSGAAHPATQPSSRPALVPASAPAAPSSATQGGAGVQPSQRPVSQPTFRPASDGYIHPAAGVGPISNSAAALRPASGFGLDLQDAHANGAAAVSRRAADPTRLLPWLRDKNKRFKTLTPEECDAMFRFASLHRLEANTILQPLDAPPTACFAIITGAIVARIRRPNGSFRELDRFGPGEVVGLLALVDGGPSPYEIQAASAVEVIAFEADKLAQFVAAMHPDALLALRGWTPMLIDYLRTVQQRVARLSTARRSRIQSRDNDVWKAGKG